MRPTAVFCLFAVIRFPRTFSLIPGLAACALLAGCAGMGDSMPGLERGLQFTPNDFDSTSMHTRHVLASQQHTCETARRALLSQGYVVHSANAEMVAGRKYYQPHTDVHYEVEMRVVCAPEGQGDTRTSAFASALQNRYVIKKVNNSASLGVGGVGSVSLPISATDDTLVKVGSETITDAQFYERFFQLFERYVVLAPAATAALPLPLPATAGQAPQSGAAVTADAVVSQGAAAAALPAPGQNAAPVPVPDLVPVSGPVPGASAVQAADGQDLSGNATHAPAPHAAAADGDVPPSIRQLMGQ